MLRLRAIFRGRQSATSFNVGEMMGPILTTIHNLRFYQRLMSEIRQQIEKGEMAQWGNEQLGRMSSVERAGRGRVI